MDEGEKEFPPMVFNDQEGVPVVNRMGVQF
jgi:hypothetical protein